MLISILLSLAMKVFDWLLYWSVIGFCQVESMLHTYTPRCLSLSLAGLSAVEEVATGVEHILADMIAKDPETLTYVKTL